MHAQPSTAVHLDRRTLFRLRWLVSVVAGLALMVFAAGVPALFQRSMHLAPTYGSTLPAHVVALFFVSTDLVSLSAFAVIAALLIWRRSEDSMALLAALMLVLTGVLYNEAVLESPAPVWVVAAVLALAETSQLAFLWLFPNGSFVPSRARWFVAPIFIWRLLIWGLLYVPRYRTLPLDAAGPGVVTLAPLDVLLVIGCFVHGAWSQVVRYRTVSTPLQRQQTKWLLFGILIVVVVVGAVILLINGLGLLGPETDQGLVVLLATRILTQAALLTVPAALVLAILRYHLFDIDRLINRTLVYAILTGVLVMVYGTSIVLVQRTMVLIGGETNRGLAIVSSTLASAALFQPLRMRVQRGIDRRFYRHKYDLAQTVASFAASTRDEVDLDRLAGRLLTVVEETMYPEHVSLWLRDAARPRREPETLPSSRLPRIHV